MRINIMPLIPAYEPDEKLEKYVDELINNGFKKILIVNDGSSEKANKYFENLQKREECIVIKHEKNKGKGQALKTGFKYYIENCSSIYDGIVTADSDGQHTAEDTVKIAKDIIENKNKKMLVLGVRDFDNENVPFKSRFGNNITKLIFKVLYGKYISDTQTGLRGFTNEYIKDCIEITGDRYEYETNMLIQATRNNVEIKEEIIETIYINDNETSHFNPIKDSLKIYKLLFGNFIKFSCSGIISFVIDWGIFVIFANCVLIFLDQTKAILFATIIARVISSIVNFVLNKNIVFNLKSNKNLKIIIIKYYALCIIQMLLSATLVILFTQILPITKNIIKIIIDICLFFISYQIQQKYIFNKKTEE